MNSYAHLNLYPWSDEIRIKNFNKSKKAYRVLTVDPKYIRWDILETNQNNYPVYAKFPEKITWNALSHNPKLRRLIQTDLAKIVWK